MRRRIIWLCTLFSALLLVPLGTASATNGSADESHSTNGDVPVHCAAFSMPSTAEPNQELQAALATAEFEIGKPVVVEEVVKEVCFSSHEEAAEYYVANGLELPRHLR